MKGLFHIILYNRGKTRVWDIPKAFDLMAYEEEAILLKSIAHFCLSLPFYSCFCSVATIFDFVILGFYDRRDWSLVHFTHN
jgi:hypothetical protein